MKLTTIFNNKVKGDIVLKECVKETKVAFASNNLRIMH